MGKDNVAVSKALSLHRITVLTGALASLCLLLLASPALPGLFRTVRAALTPPPPPEPIARYHMAFRHLGFGELSTCANAKYPIIERTDLNGATTFLVRASVACGLEVRNPSHFVQGSMLHLSYETHFTCGVDMCNCEYRSVFTFGDLPPSVKSVDFKDTYVDSCR
jgi:hypothetical protein